MIDSGERTENKKNTRNSAKPRKSRCRVGGWWRASPAAAVFRVCQRLYIARGKTHVAAFWQIRRDGASIRARLFVS